MKSPHISATMRVAIGLAFVASTVLLFAISLGFCPDTVQQKLQGRLALCETIAICASNQARQDEAGRMEQTLRSIVLRNQDVVTAAIRRNSGYLMAEIGEHQAKWDAEAAGRGSSTCIVVPIVASNKEPWGSIELRFQDISQIGWDWFWNHPYLSLMIVFPSAFLILSFIYLGVMLRQMNPSKSVPSRVRGALDTITGGLLIIDSDERIALANKAFADAVSMTPNQLQGVSVASLDFQVADQPEDHRYDWMKAIGDGKPQPATILTRSHGGKTFLVNAAPIAGDQGDYRGVLVCFEDVTELKEKESQLQTMLTDLRQSREEISRQNEELRKLATIDPLTTCFNRRAFFEFFENEWSRSERYGHNLSCVMIDIDFFKAINDNYGHSVGDVVLKKVGQSLKETVRDADIVCRYGGEEFCVVMPHIDHEQAVLASERLRKNIESIVFVQDLKVTASLGSSARELGAPHPHAMIEQADKALYFAKRSGRNRSASWANIDQNLEIDESQISRTNTPIDTAADVAVPFHAVTALISALGFRDAATADHSRRVADLCVTTANKIMPITECYIVEIAALLHDIGKIGVPDAILLKPGPLTEEEWETMSAHDRFGVEIVSSAFNSPELTEIIRSHHAMYDAPTKDDDLPRGKAIPLGARILSIADAYDAITSDRCYRKGRSQEEAFTELRRTAGTQFDPDLVEVFISAVEESRDDRCESAMSVSKRTALQIGLQIEQLALAVDERNKDNLHALAGRLKLTARNDDVESIAELAEHLEAATGEDAEIEEIAKITADLMQLCRETQHAFLVDAKRARNPPEIPSPTSPTIA